MNEYSNYLDNRGLNIELWGRKERVFCKNFREVTNFDMLIPFRTKEPGWGKPVLPLFYSDLPFLQVYWFIKGA